MDLDEFLELLMKTEREPKYPQSMYYSEGVKYLKLFQYEKALEFLNEAVANNSKDFKSLLKRSKCNIALREYTQAIDDANAVLELYPNNIHAIDLKGQAQYLMGDFEGGFMTYSIGKELRPLNERTRLGKQMCREALDNSLSECNRVKCNKNDVTTIVEAEETNGKFEKLLKNRRGERECFGKDAKFMEDLMRDENLVSVHNICKEAVDYIKYSEKFWCMVHPLNLRKKRQKIKRRGIKSSHKVSKPMRMCIAAKNRAECNLHKGRIDDCIFEARNLLIFAESLEKEKQLEKVIIKCDAYHLLGLANMQGNNTFHAIRCLLQELEMANEFDLILQQTRAYHQLGEIYQMSGNETKVLFCLNKVDNATRPEKIGKLLPDNTSPFEVRQVGEARKWANSIISNLAYEIRNTVLEPTIDVIIQYSEGINVKNGDVKEKLLERPTDPGKMKPPESMPRFDYAEKIGILNTSSKTNVLNELAQFSPEGVLERPSSFKDKESKRDSSEVKDLSKSAESAEIEKLEERDMLKLSKGTSKSTEKKQEEIGKSSEGEPKEMDKSSRKEKEEIDKSNEKKPEEVDKSSDVISECQVNQQMLDSAIHEPTEEHTEQSRSNILENLDDSSKEGPKVASEEQSGSKKGSEKGISTGKSSVEKLSSEEEDIPEEIDNDTSSEDEIPDGRKR